MVSEVITGDLLAVRGARWGRRSMSSGCWADMWVEADAGPDGLRNGKCDSQCELEGVVLSQERRQKAI